MKVFALVVLLFASSGCETAKSYSGYLVVKQETQWVKAAQEPSCPFNECQLQVFTFKYRGNTIRAHCQVWAVGKECFELKVGNTYEFSREYGMLSAEKPKVVLGIEEEHL